MKTVKLTRTNTSNSVVHYEHETLTQYGIIFNKVRSEVIGRMQQASIGKYSWSYEIHFNGKTYERGDFRSALKILEKLTNGVKFR